MENYICINGKKTELTEEEMKQLGIEKEPIDNFCVKIGEKNYYIDAYGSVQQNVIVRPYRCVPFLKVANWCNDEALMKQRALHEVLNRQLWRFSCRNGELENKWDGECGHYSIRRNAYDGTFSYKYSSIEKRQGVIYFPTKEIAQRAIDEVVIPFIIKHPEFVW